MDSRCRFGKFVVDAKPVELADGTGWLPDFTLEEHLPECVNDTMFFGTQVFGSREDAIGASYELGRREVLKRLAR